MKKNIIIFCLLLLGIILGMAFSSFNHPITRIHVLPEGGLGWFFVLEERDNGYNSKLNDSNQILIFSSNGTCRIKERYIEKWGRDRFYWQNGVLIPSEVEVDRSVIAIRRRGGGVLNQGSNRSKYSYFFVGTSSDLEKAKHGDIDRLLNDREN